MKTYEISQLIAAAKRLGWEAADGADFMPAGQVISYVLTTNQMLHASRTLPVAHREMILRAYEASYNDNL